MSVTVQAEKANLSVLEKKDRELQGKVEMMNMVEQDILQAFKLLEECMHELTKYESAKKNLEQDKELVEKKQGEIRELNVKEQVQYMQFIYMLIFHYISPITYMYIY